MGKPSHPKPTYKKTQKPTWQKTQKPTWKKTSKPTKAWKTDSRPTWQKNDHESYEKEAVSHIYNPYDIRQRGIVKAQLEERIESDMQELAALDALETVSDEQQDIDGEGVIELASSHGQTGNMCSSRFGCRSGCCERSRCVEKKRDWANIHYCPAECRGFPFGPLGTCQSVDFIMYLDNLNQIAREFLNSVQFVIQYTFYFLILFRLLILILLLHLQT